MFSEGKVDISFPYVNLTSKALSDIVLPIFPDSSCTIYVTKPH